MVRVVSGYKDHQGSQGEDRAKAGNSSMSSEVDVIGWIGCAVRLSKRHVGRLQAFHPGVPQASVILDFMF